MKIAKALFVAALFATFSVPALGQLEEIIVTAQKREESLQDVPSSIVPVTGEFMADRNIRQLDELSEITPSLFVAEGFTSSNIIIRGIGTESGGNSAFEQAVVTFIDGVAYGRERSAVGQFLDLERIEILRGPQPVFFGQSATGGALNIITKRPGEEQDGYVQAQYGSDSSLQLEGAWGGPLSDNFGIRAAGIYEETDGWLDAYDSAGVPGAINPDNVPTTAPKRESYAGRLSAVWNITDNFEMYLKGQWSQLEQDGFFQEAGSCNFDFAPNPTGGPPAQAACAQAQLSGIMDDNIVNGVTQNGSFFAPPPAASFIGGGVAFPTFDPRGINDVFTRSEYRDLNSADYNMTLNLDTEAMLITSVTGYYDYDTDWTQDVSQSPYAIFNTRNLQEYEQWSQEIRLTSPGGQTVDWMFGAYYQDGDLRAANNLYTAFIILPIGGEEHRESPEWSSLFANVNWNLTDQARLNIGGRWTDVSKPGSIRSLGGPGQGNPGVSFTCAAGPCGFGPFAIGPGQVVTGISGLTGDYLPPLSPFGSPAAAGNGFDTTFKDDNFSPQVSFEWDFNEDVMGYVKYVEAFKSGGFNASIFAPDTLEEYTYESELAEGWEAGIKSTLADGRLSLNVTVFDTEYSNLQVPGFDAVSGTFPIKNAARSSTSGLEIDGQWAPSDGLVINYSFAFTDAKFDDFPDAECGSFETAETLRSGGPGDLSSGTCLIDRTGRSLNLVPDFEFNISGTQTWRVSDWEVGLSGDIYYSDGYQVDLDSLFPDGVGFFSSYEIINFRLSVGPADGRYEIAVVGNNLTDTERSTGIAPGGLQGAETWAVVFDQGRRWSVQARYNFGG